MSRQIVDQETGQKKFDLRTHVRDAKGRIIDVRPYTLIIDNGFHLYIDKKTGKKYTADGTEILPQKAEAPAAKPQEEKQAPASNQNRPSPIQPNRNHRGGNKQMRNQAPEVAPVPAPVEESVSQEGQDENPEPNLADENGL